MSWRDAVAALENEVSTDVQYLPQGDPRQAAFAAGAEYYGKAAAALDRLEEITPGHWVVLELSSFQLESVERPALHAGVILNITPDHLDRHKTFERYVDLKARAIDQARFAVLNGRDPVVRSLAGRAAGRVVWFDQHQPRPPMPLPGEHNMENALAAAAVGRIAGLDDDAINGAIRGFKGVEHRLELVGEWAGVRWYNDSKATNPDAGRVALRAFPGAPVILGSFASPISMQSGAPTFGTPELAEATLDALEGRNAALMANHGAITYGGDAQGAVEAALLLEWACSVYWHASALGTPRLLGEAEQQAVIDAVTERRYGRVRASAR